MDLADPSGLSARVAGHTRVRPPHGRPSSSVRAPTVAVSTAERTSAKPASARYRTMSARGTNSDSLRGHRNTPVHEGVVQLYDWSPGLQIQSCLPGHSISSYHNPYQYMAGSVGNAGYSGTVVRHFHGPGGRMFLHQKKGTTKGEREIISGIVQNRGDASSADPRVESPSISSHREAWMIGKPCAQYPSLRYTTVPTASLKSLDYWDDNDGASSVSSRNKYRCQSAKIDSDGTTAPPSTPEKKPTPTNMHSQRYTKVPPINSNRGAVYIRKAIPHRKLNQVAAGEKLLMDVYLPRLTSSPAPSIGEWSVTNQKSCEGDGRGSRSECSVDMDVCLSSESLQPSPMEESNLSNSYAPEQSERICV